MISRVKSSRKGRPTPFEAESLVPGGFEPPFKPPEGFVIGHYTTGLLRFVQATRLLMSVVTSRSRRFVVPSSVTVRAEEHTPVHLGRDLLKRPLVNGQPRDRRLLFANMVKVETNRIIFRTEGTAVFLAFLFGYPRDRFGSRRLRVMSSVTVRAQQLTLCDLCFKRFLSVPEGYH